MAKVKVIGMGMIPFGKHLDRNLIDMGSETVLCFRTNFF